MLVNKSTKASCVLGWRSKQLKRKVISSLAGEAMAACSIIGDMVCVRAVLRQMFGTRASRMQTVVYTDSKNLQEAVRSSSTVDDGWLIPDIAIIKDAVEAGEVQLRRIPSKDMLADCLTKAGASGARLMEVMEAGSYELPDSL